MNPKQYKIGIVGLGPVGMILAQHFADADCNIAICDIIPEKIELIRNDGIYLLGLMEKSKKIIEVHHSLSELLESNLDILVCATKAYHVDTILNEIALHPSEDLLIVSAQNGIGVAIKYRTHFIESRIFRLVVNFAGNMISPNKVHVSFFNPPNWIASRDDSRRDLADWVSELLSSVGLTTKSTDSFSLTEKVWYKTILNAALSPLCAISKLTMREAMTIPDTNEIVERIILEAMEVAKAEDITFEKNFVKLCLRYLNNAGDHFPSLAVDLLNNRETEIDFMNGKIVEFGRKHYIRTPLNLTFTNLVKAITDKNLRNNSE